MSIKGKTIFVVFTDWRDRMREPAIIGVYEDENDARNAVHDTENEIEKEGYEISEDVNVWFEETYTL